jgi:IPT/TIG domain
MNTNRPTAAFLQKLVLAGAACVAIAFTAHAQVDTTTKVATAGPVKKTVNVERGTVVYVSGNNVVVKADDGTLRHFDNVPNNVTVTVGGKQLNVHQLQVGMTVERQTITTTTPKVVTTIKTVQGTVVRFKKPNTVVLTLEDGQDQSFTIPEGTTFNINGKQEEADKLRKGMKVSAQQVTEVPQSVVAQQVLRTGVMPPPPPPPAPDVPILIVFAPAPPPIVPEAAPVALPKTASEMPLIGLLGALFLGLGLAIKTAVLIMTRSDR